jgi:hypothetical protein
MALLLGLTQLEWFGLGASLLGSLILLAVHHVVFAENRWLAVKNVLRWFLAILMFLFAVALLLPAVSSATEAAARVHCRNNLKFLGLALDNYYQMHGHFPPPNVAGPDGKPMHSWRVLILPYIEEGMLFNSYRMDEPWNGPNNSTLAAQMPSVFRCPSDGSMPPGMTNYFYITGPGRAKEGESKLQPHQISDGMANTMAIVESTSARINWLDPRDLTVEDMLAGKNTADAPCACASHGRKDHGMWRSAGGFQCAMFDGSVRYIAAGIDPATLRAFLTIDGAEPSEAYDFSLTQVEHLWPGTWVLLGAEVAFLIFAITRRVLIARRRRWEAPHG